MTDPNFRSLPIVPTHPLEPREAHLVAWGMRMLHWRRAEGVWNPITGAPPEIPPLTLLSTAVDGSYGVRLTFRDTLGDTEADGDSLPQPILGRVTTSPYAPPHLELSRRIFVEESGGGGRIVAHELLHVMGQPHESMGIMHESMGLKAVGVMPRHRSRAARNLARLHQSYGALTLHDLCVEGGAH